MVHAHLMFLQPPYYGLSRVVPAAFAAGGRAGSGVVPAVGRCIGAGHSHRMPHAALLRVPAPRRVETAWARPGLGIEAQHLQFRTPSPGEGKHEKRTRLAKALGCHGDHKHPI